MKKPKIRILIILTLLSLVSLIIFFIFGTDSFLDGVDAESMAGYDMSMFDKKRSIRESQDVIAGVFGVEDSQTPEDTQQVEDLPQEPESFPGSSVPTQSISSNIKETDMYKAFISKCGMTEIKAVGCASAYYSIMDKYNNENFAWGMVANIYCEGSPGLVQYNKSVPNWDGNGTAATSTASSPLFVSSLQNVEALLATPHNEQGESARIGVGIIQWTNSRMGSLMNWYKDNSNGDFSSEHLMELEVKFMLHELATSYGGVVVLCCDNGATPEDCTEHITRHYEKPSQTSTQAEYRRGVCTQIRQQVLGG